MTKPRKKPTPFTQLAKLSGVSRVSLIEAFADRGAPDRTDDKVSLKFISDRFQKTAKIPEDIAQEKILIDFETRKARRDKEREMAEEKRLKNLETRGKLIEREEANKQGAALGVALSSIISGFEKDGPCLCVGKPEVELNQIFREMCDRLRDNIRVGIERLAGIKAVVTDE